MIGKCIALAVVMLTINLLSLAFHSTHSPQVLNDIVLYEVSKIPCVNQISYFSLFSSTSSATYCTTVYILAGQLCNLSTLSISKCHHTCQHNITERSAPQSILLLRPPGIVVTRCKLESATHGHPHSLTWRKREYKDTVQLGLVTPHLTVNSPPVVVVCIPHTQFN